MRCWTCLWVFSSPFNQTGNKDSAYQIHWYLQNSHHLVSVLVPQPAICPFTGYVGGERRSISHSERRGVWGLIAQRQLMCHRWLMSHEVGGGVGGERERESPRERQSRASWGFLRRSFIISLILWHPSIHSSPPLPPPTAAISPSISCTWLRAVTAAKHKLPCVHCSTCQALQTGKKKKKKKNRVEHDSTSTLRQMGFIFL